MEVSKESLYDDEDKDFDHDRSAVSKIYRLIRDMAMASKKTGRKPKRQRRIGKGPGGERDDADDEDEDEELSMIDIRARVLQAGFTEAQLTETVFAVRKLNLIPIQCLRPNFLIQYENNDVWMRVANNTKLRFIQGDV